MKVQLLILSNQYPLTDHRISLQHYEDIRAQMVFIHLTQRKIFHTTRGVLKRSVATFQSFDADQELISSKNEGEYVQKNVIIYGLEQIFNKF